MRWLVLLIPLAVAIVIFATVARDLIRVLRRRALTRELEERQHRRERDAQDLPGGRADNPIDIETPALVEPMANSEKCLRCGGDLHLMEHAAERQGSDRLRIAHMKCGRCSATRELFFRLQASRLH